MSRSKQTEFKPYPPEKTSIGKAVRLFLFTKAGGLVVTKLLFMAGFVGSIPDEPLDVIPGLDLFTISDDALWVVLPSFAIYRVLRIWHKENKPYREFLKQQEQYARQQYRQSSMPQPQFQAQPQIPFQGRR